MYNPFSLNNLSTNVYEIERYNEGTWFYKLFGSSKVNRLRTDRERLEAVLTNPAALKVFKLQCDAFSRGKVTAHLNGKPRLNDSLVNLIHKPNPFQTERQFLWDYMFWTMLGTSYLYNSSRSATDSTSLYWLIPARFEWTEEVCDKLDRMVLSKKSYNDLKNLKVRYYNLDGSYTFYKLSEIKPFFDLSNGFGNWYRGSSAIDALYKVISNSEKGLDSKGINLEFSGKFFVSGQHKEEDVYNTPMSDPEKQSIEASLRSNKPVHATKSMVDLKRFVDNLGNQKLDDAYRNDYFTIGTMYGIPRDVLEAFDSSTYENQEKAQGRHVEMCLMPKGQDLMEGIEKIFGYDNRNVKLCISWDHLSFMQVFERERVSVRASKLANLRQAQEMNILTEEEVIEQGKEIMGLDE